MRIRSLLAKAREEGCTEWKEKTLLAPVSESETALYLTLNRFADAMENAYAEKAPHKVCQYIYELSEAFNHFYHETKILTEENEERKNSYLKLIALVQRVLTQCIELLGFSAPEKM